MIKEFFRNMKILVLISLAIFTLGAALFYPLALAFEYSYWWLLLEIPVFAAILTLVGAEYE